VNTRTAWIVYVVLRLVFFAVPFAVLYLIGWPWWLALVVATLIALSLSVIFLSRQRGTASTSIYDWRNRDRTADDIVEDEALDSISGPSPETEPSETAADEDRGESGEGNSGLSAAR
jgi:hypothetical protein